MQASLDLLNQHKFSFANEIRKTLLRYFDLLADSIHTVNSMNLYSYNDSLKKLNIMTDWKLIVRAEKSLLFSLPPLAADQAEFALDLSAGAFENVGDVGR